MKLKISLLSITVMGAIFSLSAQNTTKNTSIQNNSAEQKLQQSPRVTTSSRPINSSTTSSFQGVNGSEVIGEGKYLNFDKKIIDMSVTGAIPAGFPKHVPGQTKKEYIQVMKVWVKNNPTQVIHLPGEGQYLEFDQKIKQMSITGDIPEKFPKHKFFQTMGEYKQVMKNWAKQHPDKIKPEYRE